jgi:hypothetical protein
VQRQTIRSVDPDRKDLADQRFCGSGGRGEEHNQVAIGPSRELDRSIVGFGRGISVGLDVDRARRTAVLARRGRAAADGQRYGPVA